MTQTRSDILERIKGRRIPLWLKNIYVLFLCGIHIPVWIDYYGVDRYLWFTNAGLILTTIALVFESRWLASMQAISLTLPELLWIIGFLLGLVLGDTPIGLTAYMFDESVPMYIRIISGHHLALPFVVLYAVYRLGYEPRAWRFWIPIAWLILLLTYLLTDPADNINYVFGVGDPPETPIPGPAHLLVVMTLFATAVYYPTHRLLLWLYDKLG